MSTSHPSDDDLNEALRELATTPLGPKTEREPTGPRHLTGSQAAALGILSDLFELQGQPERAGVKPRNKPLLVGPSGVGKTALVRRLCDLERVELLTINAGAWIPYGATTTPHTLTVIRSFISRNRRGCIMLDELDKACPHQGHTFAHAWTLGVFTEIISVLDADAKLMTAGWTSEQISQLRQNFFVVGAGTWQAVTANQSAEASEKKSGQIIGHDEFGVPEEIMYRFSPTLVGLRLPERKDYAQAIRRVRESLGLAVLDTVEEQRLLDQAELSRVGMRWVEDYLTRLLIAHPKRRIEMMPPQVENTDKIQLSSRELGERFTQIFQQIDLVQAPTCQLMAQLRCLTTQKRRRAKQTSIADAEIEAVIKLLGDFSQGLDFNTRASRAEQREADQVLRQSGPPLIEKLDHWLMTFPRDLNAFGLIDLVVEVLVRTRNITVLFNFITKVSTSDSV